MHLSPRNDSIGRRWRLESCDPMSHDNREMHLRWTCAIFFLLYHLPHLPVPCSPAKLAITRSCHPPFGGLDVKDASASCPSVQITGWLPSHRNPGCAM